MSFANPQHLETSHGNVEYLDVGEGVPTLYFHGTGAGSDAALMLEQSLLDSGCRLIIPNRSGYCGTTCGRRGSVMPSVDQAVDLLNHLNVDRAVVIGTSGGGMPAGRFARCHPDRTAALILQCAQSHQWNSGLWLPSGLGYALFLFRYRIFATLLTWEMRRRAEADARHPVSCLRQMSGKRFGELQDDTEAMRQISELTAMALECSGTPAGIQNDWAILVGDNEIKQDTVDCPTLIIHDRADPLVPFAHAEWSQLCIPQAHLLEIRVGGHLIWFGQDSAAMHEHRMSFLRQSLRV